ncbi:hypothetical protein FDA94_05215 [Herbidospora galbida]|uniref:Uncharacterized protein n=1 Tax=Herbidospora galbida TaxID=2575442 RepID=A0A4U3MLJ8_9ACTN|nr:hypothetical protein [Herbidospora galbida]TKK90405.1 hypothetical protein FDA94_05215 [Herbidospora galbida]
MAEVLRRINFEDAVEYGQFYVGDFGRHLDDSAVSHPHLRVSNHLGIECDITHGQADVRVEVWDAEPPSADAPWVLTWEIAYLTGSGIVSVGGESWPDLLLLGPSYFLYGLRAYRVPSVWGRSHEFYEDPQTEHVLLRFWPIRDVFDPALHARPEGTTTAPRPSAYVPATDWPTLRHQPDLPEPDTADDPDNEDWEAVTLRRARARIAKQLNPDAAPTFTILRRHTEDPRSPWGVDNVGATCRARLWRPAGEDDPGVLGVDRRIESEDGSRDEVLVSAIVTVLDEDGELLTVRDATETEAARVLAVERAWG